MNFLVIGNGGREHAIAWKLSQSDNVEKIYCAPGNGGTFLENKCRNVNLSEFKELADFAVENSVDYTFVGPEQPLVDGIVDYFNERKIKIIGPDKSAAMLEGSKSFAKDFMKKYGIRTAKYEVFEDMKLAEEYVKDLEHPIVIKSDGLEGGKGVLISNNVEESLEKIRKSEKVVIEEYLQGFEVSILSITDSETIVPFLSAKDHKQVFDGNKGPNTGGMGVVSPNPFFTSEQMKDFEENIMIPTLNGIKHESMYFCGIIFFGLMVTDKGCHLLEYNMRMGDPETQAVLPMMKNDFAEILIKAHEKKLSEVEMEWENGSNCVVVMVSDGYPGKYNTGVKLGIPSQIDGKIFISGAKYEKDELISSGGRVLGISSHSDELDDAIRKTYSIIDEVEFENSYFRMDIGR